MPSGSSNICVPLRGSPSIHTRRRSHAEKINPSPAPHTNQTSYEPVTLLDKAFPHSSPAILESEGEFHMLLSQKQQEANRKNAQHSTGPKTPEGKEAIRFNALTYGLRTRASITPDENAADYSQLWDELEAEWQPQTRTERCYLETMVTSQWLLKRVAESEQKVYVFIAFGEHQFKMLAYAAKQRAQLERSFRTAIADMQQSQNERQARPEPQSIQTEPTAKAAPVPPRTPAKPAAPPPEYVMSEGAEAHPVSCSPTTPDTR